MNIKQVLLILAIVLGSLILIFLTLLGIYKFAPGIFGIKVEEEKAPQKTQETVDYKSEPKVVLSKSEYDNWIQKSFNVFAIQNENLFLTNYSKYLQDSLKKLNETFQETQKKLAFYEDSLSQMNKSLVEKVKEIRTFQQQVLQKEKELAEIKSFIEKQQASGKALTDSAKQVVYNTFAKIYENSDPKEVAKIIELLDDRDALAILKSMNKKKAGKIIDMLKPERSAQILEASFK
ncbi:MAG: hypothetical protein N2560_00010 [Ignavibacteria bacterium]|nr:hypothetical protein [Ignavibacteria bacterium]